MAIKFDFSALKETVTGLAQSGVAQGKKVATVAKLKGDNLAQQDAARKAYTAIGKLYYAMHQGAPEEGFEELFAKVDAALAVIAENEAALAAMKEVEVVIDEDVEYEMQAGEMPADIFVSDEELAGEEATLEAKLKEEVVAEDAPAEDAPAEEE